MSDWFISSPYGKEMRELGARWDRTSASWTLPATGMNAAMVGDAALGIRPLTLPPADRLEVTDQRLYEYQRDAASRLAGAEHGLLVCLSPGLGKTAVAIAAADRAVPDDQVVVVAPASLLRTWEREIAKWATVPGEVYVIRGKLDMEAGTRARWIIVSWDKMAREAPTFGKGWPLVILDESVLAKNRQSKRFKALNKWRPDVERVWLLSGSPTTRYADDLWAQLHLIWPRAFTSYWRFAERYCIVEDTPWARSVTGTRAGRDAARENSDLMMVVNQEDVLELPEYLFEPVEVDLLPPQWKAYDQMAKDFIAELSDGSQLVADHEITRLLRLQQIASWWDGASAKHDAVLELLPLREGPHLIWVHWREGAAALTNRLATAGVDVTMVTGETPPSQRDARLEGFKRGEYDALVLSLGVGKFGHTFTNARTVWSVDRTFSADDFFQSMHRVRRIGLEHRPLVVPVTAAGTVDELTVGDNLEAKLRSISRMTKSDLATLLKGMGR